MLHPDTPPSDAPDAGDALESAPTGQRHPPGPGRDETEQLHTGLSAPLPTIAPRYFYDARGSELFEAITRTPEYYPTRAETAILRERADEILAEMPCHEIAELGSGAGQKIRLLLDAGMRAATLRRCTMLDISEAPLRASVAALQADYPSLHVRGVIGDFHRDLGRLGHGGRRMVVFLAGTIGNLTPDRATGFLTSLRALMAVDDALLLGVDLVKDPTVLERAYDDGRGITAAFNRNALTVINRRFRADFQPHRWQHVARYDVALARIEMRLRATASMRVHIGVGNRSYHFSEGAEILTEISCKYTRDSLASTLLETGLTTAQWWTDADERFGLALLRPEAPKRDSAHP